MNSMGETSQIIPKRSYNTGKRNPNYKDGLSRKKFKMKSKPFIGWDGEGYTDDGGEHHYMLWGNSNNQYVEGESLDHKTCFDLLLMSDPHVNNVVFAGDYDVIMMTKQLPWPVRRRLHSGLYVKYDGYSMRWLKHKMFWIRNEQRQSATLYDVFSFFGSSFVKACREYLGESEILDTMEEMKGERNKFTQEMLESQIKPYWRSELQYLVQLCNELRDRLQAVDINPRGWYGPGPVASSVLMRHRMGKYVDTRTVPQTVIDCAERAYYGGRFEQFRMGRHDSPYEYDIRSAYPHAISQLPNVGTSRWHRSENESEFKPFGIYRVSWESTIAHPRLQGPLPHRDSKGRIFYPQSGHKSWYWGIECRNLVTPAYNYTIHEAWLPEFDGTLPFHWIKDMYYDRAKMKAEGNPSQLALKLGMNSIYGKLAQSTGAEYVLDMETKEGYWKKPRWHNAIYAGWITACCRRRLWNAYLAGLQSGVLPIAFETDAIFTTGPIEHKYLDSPVSSQLGEWDEIRLDSILYIQSGFHYDYSDGEWSKRSRGVEATISKSADYWKEVFGKIPHDTVEVSMTTTRFQSSVQAKSYGNWLPYKRTTTMPTMTGKRIHYSRYCKACQKDPVPSMLEEMHDLSVPHTHSDVVPSIPYDFPWREDGGASGWEDSLKIGIAEQTEWM